MSLTSLPITMFKPNPFSKILIANRGEIAVRIIRACQEMGITTVAVYSQADASALHTTLADEAVLIGPPAPTESYLCSDHILAAAQQQGCDAIHPGYGFLSENADFAEAVEAAGLIFIGPKAGAIRAMGSKTAARAVMQSAGVPVVPGYQAGDSDAELQAAALELGFPLLVKAVAGGGGKGMKLVNTAADLPNALESARREAANAFGDTRIYLEKYLPNPRHVEFQIFGDAHGNVIHLFERECSVQRRHQKIIEESPSPLLDDDLRRQMGLAAVAAAQAVNYVNAGTIEFLVDANRNFYFLEMNTRLQVEHPVTELVTGLDLVKLQLHVAAGEPLPFQQDEVSQRGHAVECRIYAEDPANNFLPDIGTVLYAEEPSGPGIRVDAGVTTGNEISMHYDPMMAKLIVLAENRSESRRKMAWALRHYIILGVATNIPFLQAVMAHPTFQQGEATTQFVDRYFAGWQPAEASPPDVAFVAAALADYLAEQQSRPSQIGRTNGDVHTPWEQLKGFRIGGSL